MSLNVDFPWVGGNKIDAELQIKMNELVNDPSLVGPRQIGRLHREVDPLIPVIVRIKSLQDWNQVGSIARGVSVRCEDGWIATAKASKEDIRRLESLDFVEKIEPSKSARLLLRNTNRVMGITPPDPISIAPHLEQCGEGAIVAVIDGGCDFTHPAFRDCFGKTRIQYLWEYYGNPSKTPVAFTSYSGRIYTSQEIDSALKAKDPVQTLQYTVGGKHGTHVLGIAAGDHVTKGIAPKAKIIFVDITPRTGAQIRSFPDDLTNILLEVTKKVYKLAQKIPCVINMSLGITTGPHDGSSLFEIALDSKLSKKPNRAIVIAAGNERDKSYHVSGDIAPRSSADIDWWVSTNGLKVYTTHKIELWMKEAQNIEIEVFDPTGVSRVKTNFQASPVLVLSDARSGRNLDFLTLLKVSDTRTKNDQFVVKIDNWGGFYGGKWKLRLSNAESDTRTYNAWLDDLSDSRKDKLVGPENKGTINGLATGEKTIAVGAYDASVPKLPVCNFSSMGPTRDGRNKPEVSAPGFGVFSANSDWESSGDYNVPDDGTSMAAPAVSGLIARLFAEAKAAGKDLSIDETRKLLIEKCVLDPPSHRRGDWDPGYGYGRAHAQVLDSYPPVTTPIWAKIYQTVANNLWKTAAITAVLGGGVFCAWSHVQE